MRKRKKEKQLPLPIAVEYDVQNVYGDTSFSVKAGWENMYRGALLFCERTGNAYRVDDIVLKTTIVGTSTKKIKKNYKAITMKMTLGEFV